MSGTQALANIDDKACLNSRPCEQVPTPSFDARNLHETDPRHRSDVLVPSPQKICTKQKRWRSWKRRKIWRPPLGANRAYNAPMTTRCELRIPIMGLHRPSAQFCNDWVLCSSPNLNSCYFRLHHSTRLFAECLRVYTKCCRPREQSQLPGNANQPLRVLKLHELFLGLGASTNQRGLIHGRLRIWRDTRDFVILYQYVLDWN